MATVKLKGNPVHTNGEPPAVGQKAPSFTLVDNDLQERTLKEFAGKRKVIATVPSLDTPVCSLSAKKFNDAIKQHPEVVVLFVSADSPFAQKRACGAENLQNVISLSLVRSKKFAEDLGLLIIDGPLQGFAARSVFVLDGDDKILYREIVEEITQEPNYEKALSALLK
jgi:thiol peroxidase